MCHILFAIPCNYVFSYIFRNQTVRCTNLCFSFSKWRRIGTRIPHQSEIKRNKARRWLQPLKVWLYSPKKKAPYLLYKLYPFCKVEVSKVYREVMKMVFGRFQSNLYDKYSSSACSCAPNVNILDTFVVSLIYAVFTIGLSLSHVKKKEKERNFFLGGAQKKM